MQTKKVTLRSKRIFSEDFKKSIVKEYEQGHFTVKELSKLHSLTYSKVYQWIYRYSTYNKKNVMVVEMKESSQQKVKQLEQRIKDLERIVGQKQITIDYLEKMIDLAKDEFDIDIKKNSSTPPSTGLKNKEDKRDSQ
jgi:transposase